MSITSLKMNELNKENQEDESKSANWLDGHYNPVASIYTFTSCMGMADLHADGEHKLVIADLGMITQNMKLKVFKGTALMTESAIVDLPTAVEMFYMDQNEPKTPAISVASGPFIYIYKNLRPYFKFSLPLCEVNAVENDIWKQAKEDKIDVEVLREMLNSLREELGASVLTVRSLKFLSLPSHDSVAFAAVHKHSPLKKQSVVTCMATMLKCSNEEGSIGCLVVCSENKEVFILDPEAFTILTKMTIASVPVSLSVSGLFDVDFRVIVACRDAKVYSLKKGAKQAKVCIELQSPIISLEKVGKNIAVACMDQTIACFTTKGKKLWAVHLPSPITTTTVLNHKARSYKALLVALDNGQVRVYKEKSLCDIIHTPETVTAMRFGRFGREDGTLVTVTKGGGILIKMLKRTANFEDVDLTYAKSSAIVEKLNIPRKTKLFVDQALRERENAIKMHQVFQTELLRLKVASARAYVKTLETGLNPISSIKSCPVKLSVRVQGFGPGFKLRMSLQNTASDGICKDLFLNILADVDIYSVAKPLIRVPLLLPALVCNLETFVECITDKGIADKIKVLLVRHGNPSPVIMAVIDMPLSEVPMET